MTTAQEIINSLDQLNNDELKTVKKAIQDLERKAQSVDVYDVITRLHVGGRVEFFYKKELIEGNVIAINKTYCRVERFDNQEIRCVAYPLITKVYDKNGAVEYTGKHAKKEQNSDTVKSVE